MLWKNTMIQGIYVSRAFVFREPPLARPVGLKRERLGVDMLRSQNRLVGILLPLVLAAICFTPTVVTAQEAKKPVSSTSPTLSVTADSSEIRVCADARQVRLNANANSPDGNPIRYRWSTPAGRIVGDGAAVVWDLSGLAPGYYKAIVDIDTGSGEAACQAFASTTVLVVPCPPPPPICPSISIVCPTTLGVDQPLTFSANVASGTPGVTPTYDWTVSGGTITAGQGTSSITVDTKGLAGQTVKATLSMGGYNLDCSASCSVQMPVPQLVTRKFDEFAEIQRNDEKARLDNYAVELQNDPTATAYVIVYPGRKSKPADVQRHTKRIVDYLVNSRGIDAKRILTLTGQPKPDLMIELWIAPQGAAPPAP